MLGSNDLNGGCGLEQSLDLLGQRRDLDIEQFLEGKLLEGARAWGDDFD